MGGADVVNRSEQSRASLVSVESPHVNRLQGSRPTSEQFDVRGCDLEMFGDRSNHRLIGTPTLGRT